MDTNTPKKKRRTLKREVRRFSAALLEHALQRGEYTETLGDEFGDERVSQEIRRLIDSLER
jgi:hypothetical protein